MRDKKNFIKNELTNKPPQGSNLKVGDLVRWENCNSVIWEHRILGFNYTNEYNKKYNCFVHLNTDSYWMPHNHKELTKKRG